MKKAIEKGLQGLYYVPDHIKMQEMCNKAVAFNPYMLRFVPDHFKMQGMRDKAVMEDISKQLLSKTIDYTQYVTKIEEKVIKTIYHV